uniref:Receptor expression-enhancing protein n=1 Tax=Megaselia scalaris TaxID=36166 RepID=T1H073_MEGSC
MVSRMLALLIGILYPAYGSYRALKYSKYDEIKQWLIYWVVFAVFTFFETVTDFAVPWFPFYREIKLLIILWLVSPGTDGSSVLYGQIILPTLEENEGKILDFAIKTRNKFYKHAVQIFWRICSNVKNMCNYYSEMMVGLKI